MRKIRLSSAFTTGRQHFDYLDEAHQEAFGLVMYEAPHDLDIDEVAQTVGGFRTIAARALRSSMLPHGSQVQIGKRVITIHFGLTDASATDAIEDTAIQDSIDLLANLFDVTDYRSLSSYLRQHPHLFDLLFEVHDRLKSLRPEPEVMLEIIRDEDSPDEMQLYAVARVPVAAEDAYAMQDDLDAQWWFDAGRRACGKLTLVVEPAPRH